MVAQIKKCKQCGNDIPTDGREVSSWYYQKKKFCNHACFGRWHSFHFSRHNMKEREEKSCAICGNLVPWPESLSWHAYNMKMTCGPVCKQEYRARKREIMMQLTDKPHISYEEFLQTDPDTQYMIMNMNKTIRKANYKDSSERVESINSMIKDSSFRKKCEQCGNSIPIPSNYKLYSDTYLKRRYCSRDCFGANKTAKAEAEQGLSEPFAVKQCPICKNAIPFKSYMSKLRYRKALTCSSSCSQIYRRQQANLDIMNLKL